MATTKTTKESTKKTTTTTKKTTASPTTKAPRTAQIDDSVPIVYSHDKIAQQAYSIWKERGCQPGNDLENWLEAERRLRSQTAR